jgi:hypothetical protein
MPDDKKQGIFDNEREVPHSTEDEATLGFMSDIAGGFKEPDATHASKEIENFFNNLCTEMPDLEGLWTEILKKRLYDKSLELKVTFPMKRVSTFIVIKQVTFSWRSRDLSSAWKLHLQTLAYAKKEEGVAKSEIMTRIIWSKDGKFMHKMSPFLKPTVASLVSKIISVFGFDSEYVEGITHPF